MKNLTTPQLARRLGLTVGSTKNLTHKMGVKPVATRGRANLWSEEQLRVLDARRKAK